MAWEHDHQLVTALARHAVSRAAPDELAQFEVTAAAFLAAPKRVRGSARRDEPLGLGLDGAVVLVSTVALNVTIEVLKHVAERYSDMAVHKLGRTVRALLGRRRVGSSGEPLPALDQRQLSELHALAVTKATALQVPAEQATLIADGIVAALALPAAGSPADE